MKTYERLTKNRQDFLEALVRVVNKSFEEQKNLKIGEMRILDQCKEFLLMLHGGWEKLYLLMQ